MGIGSTAPCADHSKNVCFRQRSTISAPDISRVVVAMSALLLRCWGPQRGSHAGGPGFGRGISLGRVVPAEILLRIRTPNLRMRDDAIAANASEIFERTPAAVGVALEEGL